jgi:hypothetical protein
MGALDIFWQKAKTFIVGLVFLTVWIILWLYNLQVWLPDLLTEPGGPRVGTRAIGLAIFVSLWWMSLISLQ